jgi:hypothetical protein
MSHRRAAICLMLHIVLISSLNAGSALAQESFRLFPGARFLFGMESSLLWMSGEFLVPAGGRPGSGSKVDVASELGLDQAEGASIFLQGEILDNHIFNFDYLGFAATGIKKIPRSFLFHNRTYFEGTSLETRVELNWFRLSYEYKLAAGPSWWLAPRVGAHYILCSIQLNGESKEEGITSNGRVLDGTYPVLGFEARWLFPHGVDLGFELEGTHLVTRGFLAMGRFAAYWEPHPDVRVILSAWCRAAQYVEDYQPLNNEWTYIIPGLSAGVGFAF